jgi:hypothetical protein
MNMTTGVRATVVALSLLVACSWVRAQDVFVVANRSIAASEIRASELRDVFVGTRSRLTDGTHVVPVLLKGGPAHEVFLRNHVGDNPEEFRARWRKAVFTGQGSMPKEFRTEGELLDYIAITPGAIGYASHAASSESVKVLSVSR